MTDEFNSSSLVGMAVEYHDFRDNSNMDMDMDGSRWSDDDDSIYRPPRKRIRSSEGGYSSDQTAMAECGENDPRPSHQQPRNRMKTFATLTPMVAFSHGNGLNTDKEDDDEAESVTGRDQLTMQREKTVNTTAQNLELDKVSGGKGDGSDSEESNTTSSTLQVKSTNSSKGDFWAIGIERVEKRLMDKLTNMNVGLF